ncbi:ovarian tumor protease [Sphingopyxis macrogoltabida]|uniref:Ovarian tumor protease n=1 Tax=Sphingopyxis macrogoltabida TaxID=33050 RepID=A0AAC9FEX5_SPHMC|nr:ovarian tumor protease [Sphingopyxis macrogoltabida]
MRTSAEGLCQALACEMFPAFKSWFDSHPELRPFNGPFPDIATTRLTTIPMHYKRPSKLAPFGFTAEIPAEITDNYPEIRLSCTGEMGGTSGNHLSEIMFNGESRTPNSNENWTF